jgi:hypothetical protein
LDKLGEKWQIYEGEFKNGLFHGMGTLTLTNGEKIVGCFQKGKVNGEATFHKKNGELELGKWKDNLFIEFL